MLIVLADDFSGAAEIGGIAFRYGLTAEVQLNFSGDTHADLIVVDTDTRLLPEAEAVRKINDVTIQIKNSSLAGVKIFKKVDSVMRGHIVPEINAIREKMGYKRVFLLPANPSRGRKIIDGSYFVNGVSLDKTVFGTDPDYPISSSSMEMLIRQKRSDLPHLHVRPGAIIPLASLITADVTSLQDFETYFKDITDTDLCCGAADFFEAWLQHAGYKENKQLINNGSQEKYHLIISGSTVKSQDETNVLKNMNIPMLSFPGKWEDDRFMLSEEEKMEWNERVLMTLKENGVVFVTIDLPVKPLKGMSEIFSKCFVEMIRYITSYINTNDLHIGLTGGATASGVIRDLGGEGLKVVDEVVPGVVTLDRTNKQKEVFTVKPGSYPWPVHFLESLSVKKTK